jgi:[NiFe] hydrogenase assembly HybE family chaperone
MNPGVTVLTALAARVEELYRRIGARMAGLPACNGMLDVQLVGLRIWRERCLGVLVTPWTVSLILLPDAAEVPRLGADERQCWRFPSGEYDFMGGGEGDLIFQTCSLFSPPVDFSSHEEARAVALAALDALFEAADNTSRRQEAARLEGRSVARQPLSRRGFLKAGGLFSAPR